MLLLPTHVTLKLVREVVQAASEAVAAGLHHVLDVIQRGEPHLHQVEKLRLLQHTPHPVRHTHTHIAHITHTHTRTSLGRLAPVMQRSKYAKS